MEAISAVASFIAIGKALAATPKIIDILKSPFGAKHEMIQLTNELVLLNEFGIRIRERIQDLPDDPRFQIPQCISLSMIEANMASIISQLEELCRKCQQEARGNGPIKVSRVRWFLYRPKITSLSKRATMNREYLHAILDSASFFASTSNGRMLLDIHTIITTHTQQPSRTLAPLQFMNQENHGNKSPARIISDGDSSEAIASTTDTTIITQETSSQLTSSNVSREGSLCVNYDEEAVENHEPLVQITAALRRVCAKDCGCQCHSSTSRTRPHPATSVIYGWLNSVYNGAPRSGAQSCDVPTCQRARSPRHFNFRVPLLFCSRVLEATLSFSSIVGAGASLHLRVPRIISDCENIGFYIMKGNTEGICWEMSYRRLSPFDQIGGTNILYYLLRWRVYDSIPFILNGAMSILRGTDTGKQAAVLARYYMSYCRPDSREQTILREVIALDDESEDDSWPVHEAVRRGGDLIKALKESPDDIDVLDNTGNTPLHLALLRCDNAAMQILISQGANLNCFDIRGHTPLRLALLLLGYDQAQLLIDGGCDINVVDYLRISALRGVATSASKGSAKAVSLLLNHGVNTFDCFGNALHWLAAAGSAADIEEKFHLFVDAGVNIEGENRFNRTVLMEALYSRNGHMLRLLVGAGYRFDGLPSNKNALIQAAWYGYTESIDTIEQTKFTADVRMRNEYGRTPLETFEWRMDADPVKDAIYPLLDDDIEAFWKLLQGVRDRYLTAEIQALEKVIAHIEAEETGIARETLQSVIQEKLDWNIPAEYRTFRAIDVQIKEGMAEAAIESLEEFIEVSEDRIGSHPQDGDYFYQCGDWNQGLVIQDAQ
ncbi:ankyrin [Daldinia vernicosa]|uniref:ankyrin n=1 Tax=Daldinia vernicosa TaxID=114800 RepID=UPI0020088498|nr:ankyrin [Daldinia vernicosa]KAI0847701.1 ankyrin [Daldinia vernicosa]